MGVGGTVASCTVRFQMNHGVGRGCRFETLSNDAGVTGGDSKEREGGSLGVPASLLTMRVVIFSIGPRAQSR
jgi:hypothetical protein